MSTDVTAFQRKRRELREQTSASARMNEEGQYDPYAKADENYDAVGVKDTGTIHQEGNPPPYSLTPHKPEELHGASFLSDPEDPDSYEFEADEGQRQQEEGAPENSVTIRDTDEDGTAPYQEGDVEEEGYVDDDGNYVEPVLAEAPDDVKTYDALSHREYPYAQHSEDNVDLSDPSEDELETETVLSLRSTASLEGVEGIYNKKKADLIQAIRDNRENGESSDESDEDSTEDNS